MTPELQAHIIRIESQWWQYQGAKEQAIKEASGMTPTRWYQTVNTWIETREALEAAPVLVGRLRRLREGRLSVRSRRERSTPDM